MKVILFTIGDFPVRTYGLVVALAIVLAMGVAGYLSRGTAYRPHIPNLALYAVVGGLLGARLWEVLFFQWDYYSRHLGEVLAIWEGGLSIQGALVGGLVAVLLYARRYKLDFWELGDLVAPALVFGQGIGRVACLLNGDAYGSPTGSSFGLVYPPGTAAYVAYGSQPLWPAEVWEGQWDMIVFGLLLMLKNRAWPKGFIFLVYAILYSVGRFFLEFLRGDSPRYLFDWTAAQWTSAVIILLALVALAVLLRIEQKKLHVTE